jgi:Zn ribbon nucleic-acid-binding protein
MDGWQFNLQPLRDELLSSWLIRNSIANGSDPSYFSTAIWGQWRSWTIDFDRQISNNKLSELSRSSGLECDFLQSMTLLPTINKISPSHKTKLANWKWIIPIAGRNKTRVGGIHYCPFCLQDNPSYFTKSGRLAWNTVCTVHNCLLISNCPECNTTISPHLVTYDKPDTHLCINCGFNLKNSPTTKSNNDVQTLQCLLNNALMGQEKSPFPLGINKLPDLFETVHFFMVFFLSIYKNKQATKVLSDKFNLDLSVHNTKVIMEQRSSVERHRLMHATSKILQLPQSELIELLLSLNITQEAFMRDNNSQAPLLKDLKHYLPSVKRVNNKATIIKNKITPRS